MGTAQFGTFGNASDAYVASARTLAPSALARRKQERYGRRASVALALSKLEREHVALLLAVCELESPAEAGGEQVVGERELREALLPLLREDLRQAQRALALAARGMYGLCEDCHKPLSALQLDQRPATTRCPVCEARLRSTSRAAL